jgi:hypothetical protein
VSAASILSSSFSSSAQFSPRHAAFVSSGNGCCGVIAAVLRIVAKAAAGASSSVYFFAATLVFLARRIRTHGKGKEKGEEDQEDEDYGAGMSSVDGVEKWAADPLLAAFLRCEFPIERFMIATLL